MAGECVRLEGTGRRRADIVIHYGRINIQDWSGRGRTPGLTVKRIGSNLLWLDLFDRCQFPIRVVGEMIDKRSVSNGEFVWRTDEFPEKCGDEIRTEV